eukprot:UN26711
MIIKKQVVNSRISFECSAPDKLYDNIFDAMTKNCDSMHQGVDVFGHHFMQVVKEYHKSQVMGRE